MNNTLKLVYDNWDEDKPIWNGIHNTIGLDYSNFESGENTDIDGLLNAFKKFNIKFYNKISKQ